LSQARIVHVVHDGVEALTYLRRDGPYATATRPDLVLLDINMPKKNGFAVMQELKADPHLQSLPVIILTTSEREEDISRAYANGACSYIRKPVDLDAFHTLLERFELYWTRITRLPARKG
jgi:CheY-like chemotaxis protein